jgi:hypothetical protein
LRRHIRSSTGVTSRTWQAVDDAEAIGVETTELQGAASRHGSSAPSVVSSRRAPASIWSIMTAKPSASPKYGSGTSRSPRKSSMRSRAACRAALLELSQILAVHREYQVGRGEILSADLAAAEAAEFVATRFEGGDGSRVGRASDVPVLEAGGGEGHAVLEGGSCREFAADRFRRRRTAVIACIHEQYLHSTSPTSCSQAATAASRRSSHSAP